MAPLPSKPQPTGRGMVTAVNFLHPDHYTVTVDIPCTDDPPIHFDDHVEVRTVSRQLPNDTVFTAEDAD